MDFDITTLRIVSTIACFLTFIGIAAWAFSRKRRGDFERLGMIPFDHD